MSARTISLFALLAIVAVADAASAAQQKKKAARREARDNPEAPQTWNPGPAKLAGEIPASRVSRPDKQSDWPAAAWGADGSLYVAYIEWNDKDADRVLVRRRSPQGAWSEPIALDDGNWDHYSPAIAPYRNGAIVVWSGQSDGNFELYASEVGPDQRASKPVRLTHAPFSDFNARLATDPKGNVYLAWQSFRNGNSDIYARRLTAGKWGPEIRISSSDANDWEPSLAVTPQGTAWIAWDSYRHGNYDVYLRSFDGLKTGEEIAVTTEPTAQFHTSVAVDPVGRVWVAWDDSGINWGKDFSRSSAAPGSRGLHYSRTLGMRVYANGRVQEIAPDWKPVLTGRMTRYAELPQLAFDGAGALWVVFRHWTETQPTEIYHFYAMKLSGSQWSLPWKLGDSSGQNSQIATVAREPGGGLSVVYASDGRSPTNLPKDQAHALHYNVFWASLPKSHEPASPQLSAASLPAPGVPTPRRQRQSMTLAGKKYILMLGDCHRHTDIRGHSGVDASVLDTYRYAIDAAQLDFLGTSDHNEVLGGRWPDGLRDYQWWWTQKAVDLFSHPPQFIGVYSYEHSMNRPAGHRNMIFLKRGAPLRMIDRNKGIDAEDNAPPALWKWVQANVLTQPGQKMVIVPHTFAAGPLADWNWPNARFDCLLEIYQGCRGSYEAWRLPAGEKRGPTQTDEEGHFAVDAMNKGNVYGLVSFSDHGSTHNSWAGVWVYSEDRKGILDGMYDRRTYAASDEIILRVSSGSHMPGEEWTAPASAGIRLDASIQAMDEILRIDVVKDGKYVYTVRPGGRSATLSWKDNDPKPGRAYYYVRVFQRDPEAPEGDPEIAWSSPFYVSYK